MSIKGKDQFYEDVENLVEEVIDETKNISELVIFTPEELLEELEYQYQKALKDIKNIRNKYQI